MTLYGDIKRKFSLFALQALVFAVIFTCAIPTSNAQNADAGDVTSGLIGHWKLDETSGSVAFDSSGNSNNGSYLGSVGNFVLGVSSPIGTGIETAGPADNTGGRVEFPGVFPSGTDNPFTFSAWIKRDQPSYSVFGIGDVSSTEFSFRRGSLRYEGSFGFTSTTFSELSGQWTHISVTYDGSDFRAYRNGLLESTITTSYTVTSNKLIIGALGNATGNGGTDFDDVRLYNRPLSDDDIALLYRSYPGQQTCDAAHEAVMWYNHDEKIMQYCNGTDWVNVGSNNEPCPAGISSCGGKPHERVVFVTSTTLGANSPSPLLCQTLSDAAGLSGTYLPWYSTNASNDPESIFEKSSVPYVKVNGQKIADNWIDLIDGTLDAPIDRYENGSAYTGFAVATRTAPDGTNNTPDFIAGNGYSSTSTWSENTTVGSSTGSRRYCFEQGPPAAPTGCTSPRGKAGEMDYNLDEGVMQYCNGSSWINMGPKSAEAGVSATDLSPTAPTSGLVGHWTLDDTNTTALDAAGSNNGTMQNGLDGASDSVLGKVNNALEFDGSNDRITIPDPGVNSVLDFDNAESITISAWVISQNATDLLFKHIVGKSINLGNQVNYSMSERNDKLTFSYRNSADTAYHQYETTNNIFLDPNEWYHVALTYTFGTGSSMKMYVNGIEEAGNWFDGTGNEAPFVSNHNIQIGHIFAVNPHWDGRIDDVRIYNRALTDDEMRNLYKSSSLVGHWNLDETTGTTAVDSSGNGNDGTVSGTDFDTDTVAGVSGTAMNFDGTDDVIDIGDIELTSNDISVSAWVNFTSLDPTTDGIIGKYESASNQRSYELSYRNASSRFQLIISEDGTNTIIAASSVIPAQLSTWYHVTGTFDATTGTANIYINGVAEGTITNGSYNSLFDSTAPIRIGSNNNGTNFTDAVIDDPRIYNRALTAGEVAQLYATTGGGANPITGCANIGDTCDDGTINAGPSPEDSEILYLTSVDAPSNYNNALAIQYCDNLSIHNHDDWYLPNLAEINYIYPIRNSGDIAGTFSGCGAYPSGQYWYQPFDGNRKSFCDGSSYGTPSSNNLNVRCVRKGNPSVGGTCSNPDGVAGELVYNDAFRIMQFCNGSEWVGMTDGLGSAVVIQTTPPTGCTVAGELCSDGSILAGQTPDTSQNLYVTNTNQSNGTRWKSTSGVDDINPDSPDNGELNIQNRVGTPSDFIAMGICENLVRHSRDDWYLPSTNELLELNANYAAIDANAASPFATGQYYWSSTEHDVNRAQLVRITTGFQLHNTKTAAIYYVRCVRRD